jgi:alkaline phosphatase D
MGDVQAVLHRNKVRNFYSVSISGYHIAEAGANPITQLAFTLANGFTFVEYYLSRGHGHQRFRAQPLFFFSNGTDPEYAVIGRVARRIWAKAMKHKYGANRALAETQIPYPDFRPLAARPGDRLQRHPHHPAGAVRHLRQLQLAAHQRLRRGHHHAHRRVGAQGHGHTADHQPGAGPGQKREPLQGSFIIEELTDLVEEAVLQEFDRITERGGVLGAMETMYQRGKIQEESLHYETLKHTGELPIIGVNTFLSIRPSVRIRVQRAVLLLFLLSWHGVQAQQAEIQQLEERGEGPLWAGRQQPGQAGARRSAAFPPFLHGVASGDPLPDAVVIWTRITSEASGPLDVNWKMATDASMLFEVASGVAITGPERDYTVKVDVEGLEENTFYYYQFSFEGKRSAIGRTRTGTRGPLDRLRLAAVSCSDYRQGYFHAYARMAERNDLALVLHLGDYFYETGGGLPERTHDPGSEVYRLQDYRARFSQYRLDADLQRVHQVHPFATIWDDHDIVVDALRDTSFRHNPAFGTYRERKSAAVQAAMEWLPLREYPGDSLRIWRNLPYGELAEVFMLDTRLYDRDRFATDAADPIYGSPDHRLIGPVQMDWLLSGLEQTPARWKVMGNQVMMGNFQALDDAPLIFENWMGYPAERSQLYSHLQDNNINNAVVLTGDFHISMALDLPENPRDAMSYTPETGAGSLAVEFVVPSVTGVNFDEGETFGFESVAQASLLLNLGNRHVKWNELEGHGYVLLDLNSERAQAEFWHVDDIRDPQNRGERAVALWKTDQGSQRVSPSTELSPPIEGLPPLPPADTIALPGLTEAVLLSSGPNPFADEFTLNVWLPAGGQLGMEVWDAAGRQVALSPASTRAAGNYLIRQPTANWAPGTYLVQVSLNGERFQRKLVKAAR